MIREVMLTGAVLCSSASAAAQTGLRKGPWLMDPTRGSLTVLVELEAPGPVSVRATEVSSGAVGVVGSVIEASDTGPVTMHEITLRGLRAGTRYHYELRGPGIQPLTGSFLSAPERAASARFVLYGDTRSDRASHTSVVQAIQREAPDFVVHTGDMVADGRREEQWQEFFDIESPMLRNTVFIPVVGNHEMMDEQGLGAAKFRSYVHCAPTGPSPEMDYTVTWGATRLVLANAFDNWASHTTWAWLDQELGSARRASPDGFVMLVMHWGLFSSGPHGGNDPLRAVGIEETLRRHRVDLLVSGHDHSYERGDARGLRFVVTGGSGAPLYPRARFHEYTRFFASEHHYVLGELEGNTMTLTPKRPDGTVLERCALTRAGWDCGSSSEPPAPSPASPPAPSPVPARSTGACACGVVATGDPSTGGVWGLLFLVRAVTARCASLRRRGRRESVRAVGLALPARTPCAREQP